MTYRRIEEIVSPSNEETIHSRDSRHVRPSQYCKTEHSKAADPDDPAEDEIGNYIRVHIHTKIVKPAQVHVPPPSIEMVSLRAQVHVPTPNIETVSLRAHYGRFQNNIPVSEFRTGERVLRKARPGTSSRADVTAALEWQLCYVGCKAQRKPDWKWVYRLRKSKIKNQKSTVDRRGTWINGGRWFTADEIELW